MLLFGASIALVGATIALVGSFVASERQAKDPLAVSNTHQALELSRQLNKRKTQALQRQKEDRILALQRSQKQKEKQKEKGKH